MRPSPRPMTRPWRRCRPAAFALAALMLTPVPAAAAPASSGDGHCSQLSQTRVPGAEHQETACLDELTTAGTVTSGHTDPAD